jgi:hypothetical protein
MTVKNINITIQINKLGYISGSHVDEHEDDTLLEYSTLKSHWSRPYSETTESSHLQIRLG